MKDTSSAKSSFVAASPGSEFHSPKSPCPSESGTLVDGQGQWDAATLCGTPNEEEERSEDQARARTDSPNTDDTRNDMLSHMRAELHSNGEDGPRPGDDSADQDGAQYVAD